MIGPDTKDTPVGVSGTDVGPGIKADDAQRPALDRRTLGRQLTTLTDASVYGVLASRGEAALLAESSAHRIGITGPPGAGKSSLLGTIARLRFAGGRRVGIVCVDPTSPHSGGSILGDRIRIDGNLDATSGNENNGEDGGEAELYIRSVPSRASEDGLSDNLPDLLAALDEQHFDELWIETVGVGQASLGVRRCVDTVIVVVLPGAGDTIQAMKAGILEVGDIYVVSKGDRPGADQVAAELVATLQHRTVDGWVPPVIVTSSNEGRGLTELSDAIDAHRDHRLSRGGDREAVVERARYDVERLLHRRVHELVEQLDPTTTDLGTAYRTVAAELGAEASRDTPIDRPIDTATADDSSVHAAQTRQEPTS